MKLLKKVLVRVLILIILLLIFNIIHYSVNATGDNFNFEAFDGGPGNAANVENAVNNAAGTAISVARIVCVTIAIVMLLVIAMKYMISAPGDRADIKKYSINYVIGAFVLFGVTGILSLIAEIAKTIKTNN